VATAQLQISRCRTPENIRKYQKISPFNYLFNALQTTLVAEGLCVEKPSFDVVAWLLGGFRSNQ